MFCVKKDIGPWSFIT